MSGTAYCERVRNEGIAGRYVARRLPVSDAEEFEKHYLTCRHCQDELRFNSAVHTGMADVERGHGAHRWRRLAIGLAAVIAAGIGLSVALDPRVPADIQRLGMVEQPPVYLGALVRGQTTEADSLFDAAMVQYGAGDFAAAASGLTAALEAGFDSTPARFFLGSSLLLTGHPRDASAEFRAVIAAGESPYQAEARFYLAKALLQRGDVERARAQLLLLEPSLEDVGAAARDLLRDLEQTEQRSDRLPVSIAEPAVNSLSGDPRSEARRLWLQALQQYDRYDLDGLLALLRSARSLDPDYFPARQSFIRYMQLSGRGQEVAAELATDSAPGAACLAVLAGSSGDPWAALSEIERRQGRDSCTSYGLAALAGGRSPPEKWLPVAVASMRRVVDAYPEHGVAWLHLAESLRDMGHLAETESELRRAVVAVPDPGQRVLLYRQLASVLEAQGDSAGADALSRAVGTALLRGGPPRYAIPHLFALIKQAVNDPGVLALMRKEVALAMAVGAQEREWLARYRLGVALVDRGRPAESLDHYRRLAELSESLDRDSLRMKMHHRRGRAYAKLGRLDEAETDLRLAIALAIRLQNSLFLADAYHDLAHVHEGAGRTEEAIETIRLAVRIARENLDGHAIRMMSLRDAALIAWKAKRHDEADRAFREMVGVIEREQKWFAWAAEYRARVGDWRGAIGYYRKGLASDPGERTLNLAGLARAYEVLGLPDSAIDAARDHDRAITDPWGVPLLAELLARQGRTRQALATASEWAFEREQNGNVEGAANAWLQLAELQLGAGKPAEALNSADRAEVHVGRLDLTELRVRLRRMRGEAFMASGDTRRGQAELRAAAALARAYPTPEGILSTHLALGNALWENAPAEALGAFDRAAREVEAATVLMEGDLDRVRYRGVQIAPFNGALRVLLAKPEWPDRVERIVEWSQRRRAASLRMAANGGNDGPGNGANTLASDDIRNRLGATDAILSYTIVGEVVAVTVLSRDTENVLILPVSRTELRDLIERLQRPLQSTWAGRIDLARAQFDVGAARSLHSVLVEPVEPLLPPSARLFVVPDDVLHRVPFGALVGGSESPPGPADYSRVPFLLDRHQVVYLPALDFLPPDGRVARPDTAGAKLVAIAGEAPGAAREIDAVRGAWRAGPVVSLEGATASEAVVDTLSDNRAVLHVAAHARLAADGSGFSYIELVPEGETDGTWTVGEIMARRRDESLVVLSACETLDGPLFGGEGPLGLARAFIAAGAGAVVATHWPIGARTADLMETFYGGIADGSDPALALHKAKLRLRSDPVTAHPFFWAGFVLVAGA